MHLSVRRASLFLVFAILRPIIIQDYLTIDPCYSQPAASRTPLANAADTEFAIFVTLMLKPWRDGQWRRTASVREAWLLCGSDLLLVALVDYCEDRNPPNFLMEDFYERRTIRRPMVFS